MVPGWIVVVLVCVLGWVVTAWRIGGPGPSYSDLGESFGAAITALLHVLAAAAWLIVLLLALLVMALL